MSDEHLRTTIEQAFEKRAELTPASASVEIKDAVARVIAGLDAGTLRVAEKKDGAGVAPSGTGSIS